MLTRPFFFMRTDTRFTVLIHIIYIGKHLTDKVRKFKLVKLYSMELDLSVTQVVIKSLS